MLHASYQRPPRFDIRDYTVTATGSADGDAAWVRAAADIFAREGFCVVLGAIPPQAAAEVLEVCRGVEAKMLELDPQRLGCRGPGRYSFGAAASSGHMLHHPAWGHLLDSGPALALLRKLLPGGFRVCGGGGDFVLGGTREYQPLHSDLGPSRVPPAQRRFNPAPKIAVNFTVQEITEENGPMRVIPRRKVLGGMNSDTPPALEAEGEAFRQSKLCPLPPGAAIVRDLRVWHGGTPNATGETRFLPSIEVLGADYATFVDGPHSFSSGWCVACNWSACALPWKERTRALPAPLFQALSAGARQHCAEIVAGPGEEVPQGIRSGFVQPQQPWQSSPTQQPRGPPSHTDAPRVSQQGRAIARFAWQSAAHAARLLLVSMLIAFGARLASRAHRRAREAVLGALELCALRLLHRLLRALAAIQGA